MADKFIKYGERTLPMPPHMTLDEAKAVMARHFPELAENPKIETKKDGDNTTYVFSKQAGRKGAGRQVNAVTRAAQHLARIAAVPVVPESILKRVERPTWVAPSTYHDEEALEAQVKQVSAVAAALLDLTPALGMADGAPLL